VRELMLVRVGQTANDAVHWMIWSASDAQIIASGELPFLDVSVLKEKSTDRDVVVLLPSDQVLLKTVTLPTKWNRKLEQALPYLLEEQLAQDIDSMFIALDEPIQIEEQHAIRVACCDQAWFATWNAHFAEAEIDVQRMLPDALLLPTVNDGEAALIALGNQYLVRYGQWQVAAVEEHWLATFIRAANIQVVHQFSPVNAAVQSGELSHLEWQADEARYELPLALLANQLTSQKLTLNQGVFAKKKKQPQWWADWRSGLIAAGIATVAFIAVKGVQVWQLQKEADAYKAQAVDIYQSAFPGKVVRANLLRSQIKSELAKLEQGPSASFLKLTEQFVGVLGEVKQFSVETMRFDLRRNELRLRAKGKDFQTFGQVKALLEQQGLSVEQGSLNNDGDAVVGELRIKGA
jgi:general secretion pathway protein L